MDNCDLFSEEARKSMTKFKIYKPQYNTLRNSPDIIKDFKTSDMIATERDLDVEIKNEFPIDL